MPLHAENAGSGAPAPLAVHCNLKQQYSVVTLEHNNYYSFSSLPPQKVQLRKPGTEENKYSTDNALFPKQQRQKAHEQQGLDKD